MIMVGQYAQLFLAAPSYFSLYIAVRPAAIIFPNLILLISPFLAAWLRVESLLYLVLLTPFLGLVTNLVLLVWAAYCQERGLRIAASILALLWGGVGVLLLQHPPFPHF